MRTICMAGRPHAREIGEHVLAQHMAEACEAVGRAFKGAGQIEHRQGGLQVEFAASGLWP